MAVTAAAIHRIAICTNRPSIGLQHIQAGALVHHRARTCSPVIDLLRRHRPMAITVVRGRSTAG